MFEKGLVAYIYAETPIHPGSGASISGIADLPVQRERHTEFPTIQGSSLKGMLRNYAEELKITHTEEEEVFGKPDHVGGISITDARILAFPVRTLKGVFGWITAPLVLDRYKRDLQLANINMDWEIPRPRKDTEVIIPENSNLKVEDFIYIEELQLKAREKNFQEVTEEILEGLPDSGYGDVRNKITKDLVVVSENVFRDIVSLSTEIIARTRINPSTGTVQEGPWYEEYLPTDTLMYSLILIPTKLHNLKPEEIKTKLEKYNGKPLQIGGDETIGKGFARIKLIKGGENAQKS